MTPDEGQQNQLASPCTGLCRIVPETGICEGCFRTLMEISDWLSMSDMAKRRLLAALPGRRLSANE